MTQHEKVILETTAGLMETVAGLLIFDAGKTQLLSIHLPDITQNNRDELVWSAELHLKNARLLKENAGHLRAILERGE